MGQVTSGMAELKLLHKSVKLCANVDQALLQPQELLLRDDITLLARALPIQQLTSSY